jgi:hypothetical protein
MDDYATLALLEELAYRLGVPIRYEKMIDEDTLSAGGLCRLKGQEIILVDTRAGAKDKIRTLVKALKHFDLDDVYVRPAIRELLDG